MTHLSSLFEILQKASPYIAIPACRGIRQLSFLALLTKGKITLMRQRLLATFGCPQQRSAAVPSLRAHR